MSKIAILTDSSSSIYNVEHSYDNLFSLDIPCFIGDEIYKDFETKGDNVFYEALKQTDRVPKTSQPSVGETLTMYEKIKSLGYTHIIYLPISKELSGTYQNGFLAKDMIEGIEIDIVDTRTTVSILGSMVFEACRLSRLDFDSQTIINKVLKLREGTGYYVTLNDLTSLVKNGRLSNAKSMLANLLKLKPVIALTKEGKLVNEKAVRTYKAAIREVIEKVALEVDQHKGVVHLAYTENTSDKDYALKVIKDRLPHMKIEIFTLPATVVAHVGLQTLAVGYVNYLI
ncbi:DegV family protein [Mycoplasmatota bacterium]|nr:DegV family protein [Mycoplasmatota bacterium]